MDIEYLESLPKERFDELYDMLKKISIPKLRTASNQVRKALPDKSRSTAFEYVLQRIGRKEISGARAAVVKQLLRKNTLKFI